MSACKDPDHMEEPCMCDCGEWFELSDGDTVEEYGSGTVYCPKCVKRKRKEASE